MKKADPVEHCKLRPNIHGNVTTMRRHVSRERTGTHWRIYEQRCMDQNIKVHPTAIPAKVKEERETGKLEVES